MSAAILGADHSIGSILERKKLIIITKNNRPNVKFATSVPDPDVFGPPPPHPDPLVKSVELTEIMFLVQKFSC
jgi:hypothetical protein